MDIKIAKEIIVKDINDITPYWRNPRKNDKTVDALCEIIPVVGFNVPVVIDKDGVIIKGHARYRACVKLGITKVPCIVSDNDEEKNRLDRIADNKMSELAEWDVPELRYELEQIDYPMEKIGFDVPKVDFMDNVYEQHEFAEVTEADFQRAAKSIVNNTPDAREGIKSAFTDDEDVGSTLPEKKVHLVKIKCPRCGETFVYEQKE